MKIISVIIMAIIMLAGPRAILGCGAYVLKQFMTVGRVCWANFPWSHYSQLQRSAFGDGMLCLVKLDIFSQSLHLKQP